MSGVDPSDIGKHPQIIKQAQNELKQLDVLVCGICNKVFYLVELFQEHKEEKCQPKKILKDNSDSLSKVWAFTLWKSAQKWPDGPHNGWKIYQFWIKLDNSVRTTWETAGTTIMSYARIANSSMQEMPVKIKKILLDNDKSTVNKILNASVSKDSKIKPKVEINSLSTNNLSKPPLEIKNNIFHKSYIVRKAQPCRIAKRRCSQNTIKEHVVDKIVARRVRDKKNEYLVKWQNLVGQSSTWEPIQHFARCQYLITDFELQLAKQRVRSSPQSNKVIDKPIVKSEKPIAALPITANNDRGVRSSKVKALNQVKQWCADEESDKNSRKRKMVDSDYYDSEDDFEDAANDKSKVNSTTLQSKTAKMTPPNATHAFNFGKSCKIGNVSIVQIPNNSTNKPIIKPGESVKPLVNGIASRPKQLYTSTKKERMIDNKTQADLIISNFKKSGVFLKKKTGTSVSEDRPKSEFKIHISDNEDNSGVFRTQRTSSGVQIRQSMNSRLQKPINSLGSESFQNIQPTSISQVREQHRKYTESLQQKSFSRIAPPTIIRKPSITRIVNTQPKTKQVPIDKRLITLARNGSLQVYRNVPNKTSNSRDSIIFDDDDDGVPDPFPKNLPPPAPASPPRPLTLCPYTGNVLSRAEGELSPEPSSPPPTANDNMSIIKIINQNNINQQIEESPDSEEMPDSKEQQGEEIILQHNELENNVLLMQQEAEHDNMQMELKDDGTEEPMIQRLDLIDSVKAENTEIEQLLTNEDGSPIIISGQDGILYQVAGKNSEGQTILIAQGVDGEQNCVIVSSNDIGLGTDNSLSLDTVVADAVAQMMPDQAQMEDANNQQYILTDNNSLASNEGLPINTGEAEAVDGQITAEFVEADCPSPGGTRKVILLLPDGRLMMTEVNQEQFLALNITT